MYCLICGNVGEENVSMHRIPKNKERQWLQFFGLTLESLHCKIECCRLCSRHFQPTDFQSPQDGKKNSLKDDVIPSVKFIEGEMSFQKRVRRYSSKFVVNEKSAIETSFQQPRTCIICRTQNDPNLSYFRFPKDNRRGLWMKACQIEENLPENARLCSKHFEAPFFCQGPEEDVRRNRLKKNALPTVYLFRSEATSDDVNKPTPEKRTNLPCSSIVTMDKMIELDGNFFSVSQIELMPTNSAGNDFHNIDVSNLSSTSSAIRDAFRKIQIDHAYCKFPDDAPARPGRSSFLPQVSPDLSTPKRAKRYANLAFGTIDRQKKQIKVLNQRLCGKIKKLMKLQDVIREKRKEDMVTAASVNVGYSGAGVLSRTIQLTTSQSPTEFPCFTV